MTLRCALVALLAAAGCHPPHVAASETSPRGAVGGVKAAPAVADPSKVARTTCDYRVSAPREPPYVVRVNARCEGGTVTGFLATEPEAGPFVVAGEASGPGVFHPAKLPQPGVAVLSYTVDLDGLASRADDVDIARRFGASLLAPASSFLLRPDPEVDDQLISVHFDSAGIESGLKRVGPAYVVLSHELRVATFTTFGARAVRDISVRDATVRLAVLDGPLDLSIDELGHWVEQAAGGVAEFFQGAPASRTLVVLAPLPGRHGIPFGKMLPANAPGVIVLLGEHTAPPELTGDWVLVHELFHVGTPSFLGEGKWYDEGLATYFEPLIRARLGWRTEADVWHEFLTNMPRGLRAMTQLGLEHPERYPDTYWGGALFCLLADVTAREHSDGLYGLEDGVRYVRWSGGVASQVLPLNRALEIADGSFGEPILAGLWASHADAGSPVDLPGLFRRLGVLLGPKGEVRFDDSAPLAKIRHDLVYGSSALSHIVPVAR